MTTRWKQKASFIFTGVLLLGICLGLFIFILSNGILATNSRNKINISDKRLPGDLRSTKNQIPSNMDHRHKELGNKSITVHRTSSGEYSREEYITPSKLHNLSLHTDDLLYESKRNNSLKDGYTQGITGNFRNRSNLVWDPYPEYMIDAFGRNLHLILHQDAAFKSDKLKVTHVWLNRTEQYEEDHRDHEKLQGCFYKGRVRGDEKSAVSVSLCNGMRGHIWTTDGSFFIEPVEEYSNEDSNILHKIRRESNKHKVDSANMPKGINCPIEEHLKGTVGTVANPGTEDNGIDMDISISEEKHERRKRNVYNEHQYTLEVLIAVDRKMQEFHENEITSYILTLMQIVSNIYSDASIGNSINVAVVNIMLLKDDLSIQYIDKGVYASHLLKRFCSFMQRRPEHYDTAILLTREQICRNTTETKCDTLGLAELGTICKKQSCSIVQDNGLPAAFTIAHELGHILNMPHDDDSKCDNFRKEGKRMLNIMSSTMGDDIHPWSWSDCSRHYVSEFLEKDEIGCMEHTSQQSIAYRNKKLPGELYNLDQQCELIHGADSKYCNIYLADEKECGRLWCFEKHNTYDCRSSNLPWADGTPCRDRKHWCQKGSCVHKDISVLTPITGGWGHWSPFTTCSRTCGGGVQESQRECNNPVPANGGKYCLGNRKKYRSCNTRECPPDELDFREQQCFDMDGNNFGIKGIDRNVKWVPKYGVSPKDECKLFCRVEKSSNYFQLADKVRDGTTCSFDSFNKCVNGICRPAGCDNELNSAAQLDRCGVCQGNNDTCNEVTGNIYKSHIESRRETTQLPFHFNILTIPKGSANIDIRQLGSPLSNYIVLLDDRGDYLLNGHNVINTFKKTFPYAGVTFEYSGANSTTERVNTTYSRKLKRDLIVEILSLPQDDVTENEILMTYTYTTAKTSLPQHRTRHHHELYYPKQEIYQWKLPEWSPCDALCQGATHRSPVCVKVDASLQVSSSLCDGSSKPTAQLYTTCNMDCELIRNITSVSQCSSSCGMIGRRSIKYTCIKRYLTNNTSVFVDNTYCQKSASMFEYEECTGSCTIWSFSEWSQCTRSCGSGQQTRSIICLSHPNGSEVDVSECSHLSKPIGDKIRPCNVDPCPAWVNGEQTPCSVTCGIGQRTTAIYCKHNNQIVDKHMCAGYPMLKPIKTNCTMPPCHEQIYKHPLRPSIFRRHHMNMTEMSNRIDYQEGINSWRTGEWSNCNDQCFKNRTVYCHDSNSYNCPEDEKPKDSEKCCTFKYVASWTPCSVICGNGIRKRELDCNRVFKSAKSGSRPIREKVAESYCKELKIRKRIPKRPEKPCKKTCKWETGKWTPCPEKCSTEFATRAVQCKTRKGRTLPSEYCDINEKPQERQKCPCRRFLQCSCQGYRRVTMACTPNSRSCHGGYETKREKCKPPAECFENCLHIKMILKTQLDRDYVMYIKRKPVHIYCHNMNTTNPTEYLTLREVDRENFSLYYNKRAKDANTCPTKNRDNEFLDESIRYGRTQFKKIRIDINTLQVIEDDYTFADTHGKPQPFGTAGDCYNKNRQCPQGYFSINLKNTGFKIRSRTKWDTYGEDSSIIFAQELAYPYTTVEAYCGGYCGSCFASKETHLTLETL